jgi:hypothetical protein
MTSPGVLWFMTCTISALSQSHVTALPLVDGGRVDWASIPSFSLRRPRQRRHLFAHPPLAAAALRCAHPSRHQRCRSPLNTSAHDELGPCVTSRSLSRTYTSVPIVLALRVCSDPSNDRRTNCARSAARVRSPVSPKRPSPLAAPTHQPTRRPSRAADARAGQPRTRPNSLRSRPTTRHPPPPPLVASPRHLAALAVSKRVVPA